MQILPVGRPIGKKVAGGLGWLPESRQRDIDAVATVALAVFGCVLMTPLLRTLHS